MLYHLYRLEAYYCNIRALVNLYFVAAVYLQHTSYRLSDILCVVCESVSIARSTMVGTNELRVVGVFICLFVYAYL